jgi:hypothetical protein
MARLGTSETWPAITVNSTGLPYEVKQRDWHYWLALSLGVLGGAALIGFAAWLDLSRRPPMVGVVSIAAIGLFLLVVMYRMSRAALILYPDRIEQRPMFGSMRSLARPAIRGIEAVGQGGQSPKLRLMPIEGHNRAITFSPALMSDPVLQGWLDGVIDLTAEAYEASLAKILADPRYGPTPAARKRRLEIARRVVQGYAWTCAAIGAWAWIYPYPYYWAVSAASLAPLVAAPIIWASRGLIVLASDRKPAHPKILAAAMPPVLSLIVRTSSDLNLLDPIPVILLSWALGSIISSPLAIRYSRNHLMVPVSIVLIGAFAGFYIYSVAGLLDVSLDRSAPEVFPVLVRSKSVSGSRSRTYNLDVSPWGADRIKLVSVSSGFYDRVQLGDMVCIRRHPGWLHMSWYVVRTCTLKVAPAPHARG